MWLQKFVVDIYTYLSIIDIERTVIIMMSKLDEFRSFVATLVLSSTCERYPMTLRDADYTMKEWDKEGAEYPEGLSPTLLAILWNRELKAQA